MKELSFLTIGELSPLLKRKEVSPLELTRSVLSRTDELNGKLNAYITVLKEEALQAAREAEKEILAGNYLGPLHGIPIAVKDLIYTKGVRTTAGSRVLEDFVPEEDATVVVRLKEAGAVLVGKTNTYEFAYGCRTYHLPYGPARNPWDLERMTGGSSNGSAAAVAASLCSGALGSDTGGSVRVPASLCGIVGLMPTYGRVSLYGAILFSWSLDHIGPITKSVEDAALMLRVIAGHDPKDAASSKAPVPDYTRALQGGVKGLRLGLPKEHFFEGVDEEVGGAVRKAARILEGLGARVEEVSLSHARYCWPVEWVISGVEQASYHETAFKGREEKYGHSLRMGLEVSRFLLATHYLKAQRARSLLKRECREALSKVDLLLAPTMSFTAPVIDRRTVTIQGREFDILATLPRLTCLFNLASLPAISVPCGFSSAGLPIGLQIAGRPFDEETVLRAASAYKANTEWHKRRPNL